MFPLLGYRRIPPVAGNAGPVNFNGWLGWAPGNILLPHQQIDNPAAAHVRPWFSAVFRDFLIVAASPLHHCVERGRLRGSSRQH